MCSLPKKLTHPRLYALSLIITTAGIPHSIRALCNARITKRAFAVVATVADGHIGRRTHAYAFISTSGIAKVSHPTHRSHMIGCGLSRTQENPNDRARRSICRCIPVENAKGSTFTNRCNAKHQSQTKQHPVHNSLYPTN